MKLGGENGGYVPGGERGGEDNFFAVHTEGIECELLKVREW